MKKQTNCKICERELILEYIRQRGSKKEGLSGHFNYVSNEGVCFENKWFCNKCWEELTKDIDKDCFKTALEYEEVLEQIGEEIA